MRGRGVIHGGVSTKPHILFIRILRWGHHGDNVGNANAKMKRTRKNEWKMYKSKRAKRTNGYNKASIINVSLLVLAWASVYGCWIPSNVGAIR